MSTTMPAPITDWIDELLTLMTQWRIAAPVAEAMQRHLCERGRLYPEHTFTMYVGANGAIALEATHFIRSLTPRELTWIVQDVRALVRRVPVGEAVPLLLTAEEYTMMASGSLFEEVEGEL